jgi:hypothetical protein
MFIILHAEFKIGPFQLADDAANYARSRIGDHTGGPWTIEMLVPPTPLQLPAPPPDTGGLTKKGIS